MPSVRLSPAIVLRSWPYGESDKIVSFYTRNHGKVSGIAKGAKRSRRRFLNVLEPFSLVRLSFHERRQSGLVFIQSCDWVYVFKDLNKKLSKISYASYLIEITDELTREREENPALFDHLREGLLFIEDHQIAPSFLTAFEMKLLRLSGYEPMLQRCRRCGKRPPLAALGTQLLPLDALGGWSFSPREGGILCRSCCRYRKEAIPLSLEALGVLAHCQRYEGFDGSLAGLPTQAVDETRALLPLFIQFQISKKLKSVAFLDTSFVS